MSTELAPLELVETGGQTDLGPNIVHALCARCYPPEACERGIALCGTETATRVPMGPKCVVCLDLSSAAACERCHR
jgi:hypothetical protein